MEKLWNAVLEVDLENYKFNYNKIKSLIGDSVDIMPIIKDNAYGSHINFQSDFLKNLGVKIVGVATVDEGIAMRNLGFSEDILILNQPYESEISSLCEYNLTAGIGSIEFLDKLGNSNGNFKIHMEIGTGMGRTGIRPDKTQDYIAVAKKYNNIDIEGIYTHFSCSDCDKEYTEKQISSFNFALEIAKEQLNLKYIHSCNSAGILNYPEAHFNLIRPGLILLGYYPTDDLKSKIKLKPVLKLKTKISFLKEVEADYFIGYGKNYCTKRKTKVATIQLGYADGLRRSMSNTGNVLINGKLAPIIGNICMDCFMADVTDIDVKINDDVYIWDNENITVDNIANIYNTINYEVLSTISERVVRKFI